MVYKFKNQTTIEPDKRFVFDIAEDEAELRSPVRVETSADFVKQRGGVAWNDTQSVRAWFDFEKGHHLDEYNKIGIYRIG
jgi:hypothetical protein